MCDRVVVTGANGFIGKALTKQLLLGNNIVYAVVRNPASLFDLKNYDNLNIVVASMYDYNKLSGLIDVSIDKFYHLAWDGYGDNTDNPKVQYMNVLNSIDAFTSAELLNVKKFIFTGTSHEFLKLKRTHELCSVYGSAKSSFKNIARVMAANSSMKFNSTVFSHVFGENDYSKRSSYRIIKNMLENVSPKLASSFMKYDWTYIDDAVNGLICVGDSKNDNKDYYIGSKRPCIFSDIIIEVKNAIAPNLELIFGEYKEDYFIDYDLIDMQALYVDTNFSIKNNNFRKNIVKTANWIKNNNI